MSKSKPAGIKEVAKYANVSISTVSNVLNGTKAVSEPLKERVLKAVKELNYEANTVARGLKSGRTNNIAVIVSSITSVFFPPLLKSIQTSARKSGYMVSVFDTGGDIAQEWECIREVAAKCVDGILLSSCMDTDSEHMADYIDLLSALQTNAHPIPLICLESTVGSQLDAVVIDDCKGLSLAVEHLLSLGRRQIAYIASPTSFSMGKLRQRGYLSALEAHQIPVNQRLITEGDYTPSSGYQCMQELLRRGEPIDAVAAGNDQMAIGAVRAIMDAGLRIPDDIAVTGYNDNFPASLIQPSLTTIHVPREEMGQIAFELFLRRFQTPDASRMLVRLNGNLIIRNSTDPSAQTNWNLENW